jgi:hypothetical protein
MNHLPYDICLSALEEQAYLNARLFLADSLKRLAAHGEAVKRLQRNLSIMAQAADIAASNPPSNNHVFLTDEGTQWRRDVDLMKNIHLCHCTFGGRLKFAVAEHFPAPDTYEIWNQGHNAIEVLRAFAGEQRQALQVWTKDVEAQLREFLDGNYPGHDMSRVGDELIRRFPHTASRQPIQAQKPVHTHHARA